MMTDRDFWRTVLRHLLGIAEAIRKYKLNWHATDESLQDAAAIEARLLDEIEDET